MLTVNTNSLLTQAGRQAEALLPASRTDAVAVGVDAVFFFTSLAPPSGTACEGLCISTSS